jgi:hypothetical protein
MQDTSIRYGDPGSPRARVPSSARSCLPAFAGGSAHEFAERITVELSFHRLIVGRRRGGGRKRSP